VKYAENGKVQTAKKGTKQKNSSELVITSKFNIPTVHLMCFGSFIYPLNAFQTSTNA